ncbi:MAG: HTH domain-containing protein [Clostridia bacterium]|nr:HTH domain-containing protein [Clostridia bacterium]
MRDTAARRIKILELLCEQRTAQVSDLASRFSVSRRTVYYDLSILSCSYPILFQRESKSGGVHVVEGFHLGMKYLTYDQCQLLERLSTSLTGEDLELIRQILKTFRNPILQK